MCDKNRSVVCCALSIAWASQLFRVTAIRPNLVKTPLQPSSHLRKSLSLVVQRARARRPRSPKTRSALRGMLIEATEHPSNALPSSPRSPRSPSIVPLPTLPEGKVPAMAAPVPAAEPAAEDHAAPAAGQPVDTVVVQAAAPATDLQPAAAPTVAPPAVSDRVATLKTAAISFGRRFSRHTRNSSAPPTLGQVMEPLVGEKRAMAASPDAVRLAAAGADSTRAEGERRTSDPTAAPSAAATQTGPSTTGASDGASAPVAELASAPARGVSGKASETTSRFRSLMASRGWKGAAAEPPAAAEAPPTVQAELAMWVIPGEAVAAESLERC